MKLKTHSGVKKRIKVSARGKISFRKPCKNHLLVNKSKRQKALYNTGKPIESGDEKRIKRLLPNYF